MSAPVLYAGPGKCYRLADNSVVSGATGSASARAFQAEGENGPIKITLPEDTSSVDSAMFANIGEQIRDQIVDVTFKPFDNWGSLDQLFPPWLGVTVGTATGSLQVGGRPFAVGNHIATKVWTPDGRLYNLIRTAVIGHPSLHLGVGKPLFGDARIVAIGDETKSIGADAFLFAGTVAAAVTETGAVDPGGQMTMADFVRGAWTGIWGTAAGFGGTASSQTGNPPIQAEDEWAIDVAAKYDPLKVQGRTYNMKLASVKIMAKCRPYGPAHTDILAVLLGHTQGQLLGYTGSPLVSAAKDLVLTGPQAKTITLHNCQLKGAGFDFGGTTLGTGEVGFVTGMTFSSGAPDPFLTFSA
jgi:hypothetical protein